MPKPVVIFVLNRNLGEATDQLVEHLLKWNGDVSDLYVIESGSDIDRRSTHPYSFVADWPEATQHGLRYARGFNFGLLQLDQQRQYDYYFLVCNDSLFPDEPTVNLLLEELVRYPRIGILSPCAPDWGEAQLIPERELRLFWFVNHISWLVRRDFLDCVLNFDKPSYIDYLYDGQNFRGYGSDIELIAKAYANDYAAGISKTAKFHEDRSLTDRNAEIIKTDPQSVNKQRMYDEGMRWMRRKYGFNSRWSLTTYVKVFYNQFFDHHPDYRHLRV